MKDFIIRLVRGLFFFITLYSLVDTYKNDWIFICHHLCIKLFIQRSSEQMKKDDLAVLNNFSTVQRYGKVNYRERSRKNIANLE